MFLVFFVRAMSMTDWPRESIRRHKTDSNNLTHAYVYVPCHVGATSDPWQRRGEERARGGGGGVGGRSHASPSSHHNLHSAHSASSWTVTSPPSRQPAIHTYTACGNADSADAAAHAALLAATVAHLLGARHAAAAAVGEGEGGTAPPATGAAGGPFADTLARLLLTIRELYPRTARYVRALADDPAAAVVTAAEELPTTCPGMTKPLALSLAWRATLPDAPARAAIVAAVLREWVGRAIGGQQHRRAVGDWFSLAYPVVRLVATATGTLAPTPPKLPPRHQLRPPAQ